MTLTINFLKQSHSALRDFRIKHNISIRYLEGIAEARFAIAEVASLIGTQCSGEAGSVPELLLRSNVMQFAEQICEDPDLNQTDFGASGVDVAGPVVYLIKLLVRQFGFPCLKLACERYQWIVPENLHESDEVMLEALFI